MKRIVIVFFAVGIYAVSLSQTLTTVLLPQYIEGVTPTNLNRIPFAYRARLAGLLANSTYRFYNQIILSTDAASQSGSGNCIFASATGNFVRTSGPGLSTAGTYGSFTTDGTGSYEGWFITEPTGNKRFVPGRYVFMRITLNDGAGGTTAVTRLTASDSVQVVKLDPALTDSTGTGLRCTTAASPKDFIFVYGDTGGTGRPLSGSFIESDGTDNSATNSYAAFYSNNVDGVNGAFGLVPAEYVIQRCTQNRAALPLRRNSCGLSLRCRRPLAKRREHDKPVRRNDGNRHGWDRSAFVFPDREFLPRNGHQNAGSTELSVRRKHSVERNS